MAREAIKPFMERSLQVRRLFAAFSEIGITVSPEVLENAYTKAELERRSKLNDVEFLRARLAELTIGADDSDESHAA